MRTQSGSTGASHLIWTHVHNHFCLKACLLQWPSLLTGLPLLLMLLLPLLHASRPLCLTRDMTVARRSRCKGRWRRVELSRRALRAAHGRAEHLQSTCLYLQPSGTSSATTRHPLAVTKSIFPRFLAEVMLHHKKCSTSWLWTFDSKRCLFLVILTLK